MGPNIVGIIFGIDNAHDLKKQLLAFLFQIWLAFGKIGWKKGINQILATAENHNNGQKYGEVAKLKKKSF